MGSTLTGSTVASTYQSLLKVSDNSSITSTLKTITDGSGVDSGLQLSTTDLNAAPSGGNFTVNTNKFTVAGSSGNTSVGGTLNSVGAFTVNTNKFSVLPASGNTTVAGTLSVAGAVSLSGGDLTTNNRIILNGNYGISQNASGASNLFVAPTTFNGLVTFTGGMQFQSAVNMTNNLTVAGVTTLNGNIVLGDAAGDTITITGTPTFAQTVTFNGIANFNGNVAIGSDASDTLTVNAVSTFVGNASFNGNTTIGSDATDTLTVNAAFNPATVTYDSSSDFVLIQDASDSNKIKKATVASVFGKKYTSAEYAIPTSGGSIVNNANILNDTHQLGGVPDIIQAFLVCQYAYDGFSVGDVITMDYAFSGTYSPPIQLIANSSNVIANMTTWNGEFDAYKANGVLTGVRVDLYPNRWKIKVVAIKFG